MTARHVPIGLGLALCLSACKPGDPPAPPALPSATNAISASRTAVEPAPPIAPEASASATSPANQPPSTPAPLQGEATPAPSARPVLAQALAFSLPAPTTAAQGPAALQLWATHYYVHQAQAAAPGTSGVPLLDQAGRVLSRPISAKDWCGAAIEGTVQVPGPDGSPRTLNYAGTGNAPQVDCASATGINPNAKPWILATGRSHFSAARGPFGDGVAGYQLVPFRTVAVDRKTLPYGTVIFVPAARGVAIQLPDGRKLAHDGYFFAGDTGGAIQGTHIDVFCGVQAGNCFPGFVKSQASTGFAAQVVADEAIAQALRSAHGR